MRCKQKFRYLELALLRFQPNFLVETELDERHPVWPTSWRFGHQAWRHCAQYWLNSTYIIIYIQVYLKVSFIERFSFECRKAIGFAFCTPHDWLKKLAKLFHPIRSKTKTNRDSLARVFPRFASASCNYFEFWLVRWIVCVLCDWLE